MSQLFHEILYKPLFNALIFLYNVIPGHDLGIAIIMLIVLIRLILFPLFQKSVRAQMTLSKLQPEIRELQKKYKDKKEQGLALMEFYKKNKANPLGGCLPLLLQLPILIALYQVFFKGFGETQLVNLYGFITHPGTINLFFLGLINLSAKSWPLVIAAAVLQFIQAKMTMPAKSPVNSAAQKEPDFSDVSQRLNQQMVYFSPLLTLFILWSLPSVIGLYWIVTTLFSILQQYLISKELRKIILEPAINK